MPQFDFLTSFAQFLIAFLGFVAFYALALKFVVPSLFSALRTREKLFLAVSTGSKKIKASKLIAAILSRIYKK